MEDNITVGSHNEIPTTNAGLDAQIDDLKRIQKDSVNPRMKPVYDSRMAVLVDQKLKLKR
jgi:hypothetical protein